MYKKKNTLPLIALICAAVSLLLSVYGAFFAGAAPESDDNDQIQQLSEKIAALQAQVDDLTARLEMVAMGDGLKDWSLALEPTDDGLGAKVTLKAVPARYEDGMKATFLIRLEGAQIAEVPCAWENECYVATAEINAADGYGYYCVLTDRDGARQQIALTTPENPVEDMPVYLETSLNAYCNMVLDGWETKEETLVLSGTYIQVQLPRLSADDDLSVESVQAVLTCNGEQVHTQPLTLEDGEGERSFEGNLTDLSLPLPELKEDDQLELFVEVLLSDGRKLTSSAASWFKNGGELYSVVG